MADEIDILISTFYASASHAFATASVNTAVLLL